MESNNAFGVICKPLESHSNMRILLLEADASLARYIMDALTHEKFLVDWIRKPLEIPIALSTIPYSLVILDIDNPISPKEDVLKLTCKRRRDVPILVISIQNSIDDRVTSLNDGADDYLGKPYDILELVARSRALLRRSHGQLSEKVICNNIIVDMESQNVYRDGRVVVVTAKEFVVLKQLVENLGMPQSRQKLEGVLYGWTFSIASNAVEVHIYNLRRKLGSSFIKTRRGVGYLVDTM